MIQPLWFGGTSAGSEETASSGLDMLHLCPAVEGAKQLTNDGLYWGGDPAQAQEAMKDPSLDRPMSGFDFKFYVQTYTVVAITGAWCRVCLHTIMSWRPFVRFFSHTTSRTTSNSI